MSLADQDREESRAARREDRTEYVVINGEWCDINEVPIELRGVYER